jgi:ABC-type nitrate/sulfonate/bicarbonate transport system substrate-binding protein
MHNTRRRLGTAAVICALVAALAVTLAACGGGGSSSSSGSGASSGGMTKINFMADYPRPPWVAQIPWVVAMKKGWYKEAGLDVNYQFPSTPADPARFVGIGQSDLTVSYTPDLLTAKQKGLDVKALASVFDRNVEGIMVWGDSGITTPKQLEGKTVAIYDFPMAQLNWQTFAKHYGIDTGKVKKVSEGNYGVPLITANKVNAIDAAAPSELVDAELHAKKPARFWVYLKENGIPDFYWFVIAGNGKWLSENPDAARKFVAVTERGVAWAMANPKEAVQIFHDAYPKDVSMELATKAWDQILKYDKTRFVNGKPAGWMDPKIWQSYEQFLQQNQFLKGTVDVNSLLTGNQYVGG